MKRSIRTILAVIILFTTVFLFVWYFVKHPEYWRQLGHVGPWTLVWVLLLNCAMIGVLVLIGDVTIRLAGNRLKWQENFLLSAYSSIANFFGPLQSGPGVRAVYLKTKHHMRLRDYTLASLIALGLFAFYSALFLLVGTRPWWQTASALVAVGTASYFVIRLFMRRDKKPGESHFHLTGNLLAKLMIFTFLQVVVTIGWYYVELKAVNPTIHFSQAMSYAGAANFSLFVSITPDGVGIREAFLLFSQSIHHVSTPNIVSANVIDRAAYIVFLGLLFLVVLMMHGRQKLQLIKRHPTRQS